MKYIIKSVIILASLLLSIQGMQAQQDSQYTQYMYNTATVNPAYAGSREVLSILALYRSQWIGLDGAPEVLNFSGHTPVGEKVGLGLSFTNDRIGPTSETTAVADFSYTIMLGDATKLSFGVKAGGNFLDVNMNELNQFNVNDPLSFNYTLSSPVIGAGTYLHTDNWYVGLSVPNFLTSKHYDIDSDLKISEASEEMHAYLIAGYVFNLNPNLKFKPAVLTKAVYGSPLALDLSANFLFHEKLTLGAAYRLDAAVSGMAGFQVNENIMVGYAYDYETTELSNYNDGSHEIFLRFELGTRVRGVVNPRFF